MKKIVRFPLVLGIVGAICAAALGLVFQLTKPLIEGQQASETLNAIQEIMPEATGVSDVTTTYSTGEFAEVYATTGIKTILEIKVGDNVSAYGYQTAGDGYGGEMVLLFVVSANEDKFIGMKVISNTETPTYGGVLLSEAAFGAQFKNLDLTAVDTGVTQNVDGLQSSTKTLNTVKLLANRVAGFHSYAIQGGDLPIEQEVPEAELAKLNFPEGTEFMDVTAYYQELAGDEYDDIFEEYGIKYLYYAMDGHEVIGYVYYIHFEDKQKYDGYNWKEQYIRALFSFGVDYTNSTLNIFDALYTEMPGSESVKDKVAAQYSLPNISEWFNDVTSIPTDTAAGVTITSNEVNMIMRGLVQTHKDLNVTTTGGGE